MFWKITQKIYLPLIFDTRMFDLPSNLSLEKHNLNGGGFSNCLSIIDEFVPQELILSIVFFLNKFNKAIVFICQINDDHCAMLPRWHSIEMKGTKVGVYLFGRYIWRNYIREEEKNG